MALDVDQRAAAVWSAGADRTGSLAVSFSAALTLSWLALRTRARRSLER